eukprot:9362794-Pyramimonas_sp.AAC.1
MVLWGRGIGTTFSASLGPQCSISTAPPGSWEIGSRGGGCGQSPASRRGPRRSALTPSSQPR